MLAVEWLALGRRGCSRGMRRCWAHG